MSKNPYELSDKAAKLLNRKAIRRFDKAKRDCNLLHIDELNVIKVITQLYKDLAEDNKKAFFDLAVMAYQDAEPRRNAQPTEKWLDRLLAEYDPVTLWLYLHEIDRKRDYMIESVIASHGKAIEFQRGLRYWARMTAHMTDRITDEATLKAYRDAGVKKVIWRTEEDDVVCEICGPRDKKIYPIDKVPVKPHRGCRCWLEAAKE